MPELIRKIKTVSNIPTLLPSPSLHPVILWVFRFAGMFFKDEMKRKEKKNFFKECLVDKNVCYFQFY